MKNVFGVNVSYSAISGGSYDGSCFFTKYVSPQTSQHIDYWRNEAQNFKQSTPMNPLLLGGSITAGFIGACSLLGAINALDRDYIGSPLFMFLLAVVLFVACGALWKIARKEQESRVDRSAQQEIKEQVDVVESIVKKELSIPDNAPLVDILTLPYVLDSKGRIKKPANYATTHIAIPCYCYVSNANLCIATSKYVCEIPLSSVRSARLEKKKSSFPEWTKMEKFSAKKYKPFKVTYNPEIGYLCKYYKVEICDIKGEFELHIPGYDFEAFTSVTGISALV